MHVPNAGWAVLRGDGSAVDEYDAAVDWVETLLNALALRAHPRKMHQGV